MTDTAQEPEFSRKVAIADLGRKQQLLEVEADVAERAALAERFDLVSLDSLSAKLRLTRERGEGTVSLHAHFAADVVQSCVVTLEPIAKRVEETIELTFVLASAESEAGEIVIDPYGEDPPEPLVGDFIDVGEVVAEHLALALDPYPRLPGVSARDYFKLAERGAAGHSGETESPFACLRVLKETD